MKKLYVLCLLTLGAVVLDVVFFRQGSVAAQSSPAVHIERVLFNLNSTNRDVPVNGRFLGFRCIDTPGGPQCFVASGWVQGSPE